MTLLSNCILGMSLLIVTRMKGQNEIFCQPTIASIFLGAAINSNTGHRQMTTALKHSVEIL